MCSLVGMLGMLQMIHVGELFYYLKTFVLTIHKNVSSSLQFNLSSLHISTVDTTIRQTYNINPPPLSATIAAIIYMYVEPTHRNRNVGSLALDVISAIQSVQGVDFTVLVAAGDEGLVEWYEKNGYVRAPLLQDVMGSPGGEFGVTMIAPVRVEEGFFEECDLRWW